jgi:GTP pyrophosphokinase
MDRKAIAFEQLSDVIGFRVIAPSVAGCYRALGVVHTAWPVVPLRFKDYISTPKQNDYRSLHTTVIGPGHQRVELQIRTDEMDRVAEYGIAAHALYKDEVSGDPDRAASDSRAYEWLRRTVSLLAEGDSPEEFLEHTKLELFQDQVFCFTPKGRLIALPRGATAIDFAYAVHTDVGNTCVGCKINGRIAPLVSELTNGDEVEIVRAEGQRPPAAWEALVTTGKARAAIRRATRAAIREQYAEFGRRIIERAFERAGKTLDAEMLKEALPRLARNSVEDVLAAVGRGEMPSANVLRAVDPDFEPGKADGAQRRRRGPARWLTGGIRSGSGKENGVVANSLPIRGLRRDVSVRFAPNGGALPGDRIIGILTPGEGVTIYPIQSPALKEFEQTPERWLDVQWDAERAADDRFPCGLAVTSLNEPGTLAAIAKTIAEEDGNIENLAMAARSPDFHEMVVDLTVHDLKHLTAIIRGLKRLRSVSSVARVNG